MARVKVKIDARFKRKYLNHVLTALERALPKVAEVASDQLQQIGDQKLHTSSLSYKQGLQQPGSLTVSAASFKLRFATPVSQALEKGFEAFDLKPGMLRSGSVKFAKKTGAPYVDVSFRHGHDTTTTRLKGMPSDVRQKVQSSIRREQRHAKKEGRSIRSKYRVTGTTPGVTRTRDLRFKDGIYGLTTKTKVGLFADMLRMTSKLGGRGRAQYRTLRRISAKSDPAAWWHPGFKGVKAIRSVRRTIVPVATKIVLQELRKEGFKV